MRNQPKKNTCGILPRYIDVAQFLHTEEGLEPSIVAEADGACSLPMNCVACHRLMSEPRVGTIIHGCANNGDFSKRQRETSSVREVGNVETRNRVSAQTVVCSVLPIRNRVPNGAHRPRSFGREFVVVLCLSCTWSSLPTTMTQTSTLTGTEHSAQLLGANMYYFEVIDCGRRILLTGVLVFIKPNSPEQAAIACMFAFASLLGFELLRPHLDPADSWIYRLVRPAALLS